MKDKYIQGWNSESNEQYFEILNRNALQNVNTESDYKNFICDYLNQQSSQEYENVKLKSNIEKCEFKNIIEKIEVYETGILSIFNNGLELFINF